MKNGQLECAPLISPTSNPKVITLKYFSISFVAEVTNFSSWGFLDQEYLMCCWNHGGGWGREASHPTHPSIHPPSLLHVTEQVRSINRGSSCGPLLHTCGPGLELVWACPLTTLVGNVNTSLRTCCFWVIISIFRELLYRKKIDLITKICNIWFLIWNENLYEIFILTFFVVKLAITFPSLLNSKHYKM